MSDIFKVANRLPMADFGLWNVSGILPVTAVRCCCGQMRRYLGVDVLEVSIRFRVLLCIAAR